VVGLGAQDALEQQLVHAWLGCHSYSVVDFPGAGDTVQQQDACDNSRSVEAL